MKRFQDWKFLATMVAVASVVAMTAVICAKSISILFKLDRALTVYLRENSQHKKPVPPKPEREEEDLFGI